MGKNNPAPDHIDDVQAAHTSRRKTSLAAAVAGVSTAAILLSSGTVALWQDAVKMDGGNITAGNLDVEKLGTLDWFENSNNVANKGSLIDLTSYKTTPGDALLGKQKLDIGLEGDNLYATANVSFPELPSGELYATPDGVALSYVVVDRDGNEVIAETPVGQTSAAWNANASHVSGKIIDNTVDYVVQVKAAFDKNTSARVRTQTQAMLGKLQFNIQQVRSPIAAASTVTKMLSSSTIKAGDEITVTYTVDNIGAETLTNITINDPLLTAAGVDLSSVKIAPGGSHTFTAKIKVTKELSQQAELFNGEATATGVAESGEVTSTGNVNASSDVVAYSADISIVGSAKINDLNDNGALDYNETVTYSWVVKNTGTDAIKNLNVVAKGSPTSAESGDVVSGSSRTFTATYSPTSDDLLSVLNMSATANGLASLDNAPVTVSSEAVTVNTVKPVPNATFTPTATLSTDKNSDGVANVGDVMTFTAKLTNTGNVALNDVKLSGSLAGVTWDKTTVTTVIPGETITFAGTKMLEASDLASGAVNNALKIDYIPAASSGSLVDNTKSGNTSITAALNTNASITGSYVINNDGYTLGKIDEGESVILSYVIKNTGDEPLKNVDVSVEGKAASSADSGDLGVGASRTFTLEYKPTDFSSSSVNVVGKMITSGSVSGKSINGENTQALSMVYKLVPVDARTISAGNDFSCAIRNGGEVWCAGDDTNGQLGDGAGNSSSSIPVKVAGIDNAVSISSGSQHTLALLSDGSVKSWGYNVNGQLGLGDTTRRLTPVIITGLTDVKQVVAGQYHSFALLNNGDVKAWGRNTDGQLGDGSTNPVITPVTITGLNNVKQIAAGLHHSLAVLNDGSVKSWGYNLNGQLGLGDTTRRLTPVIITGLTDVNQVASGNYHSLALLNTGDVKSWGANNYGQLGLGDIIQRNIPTLIGNFNSIKQVVGGEYHSVAINNNGSAWATGLNNSYQLGLSNTANRNRFAQNNAYGAVEVTAGANHALYLDTYGDVKVWGLNSSGQLGNGNNDNKSVPVPSKFGK